jgi:hypothetical protein
MGSHFISFGAKAKRLNKVSDRKLSSLRGTACLEHCCVDNSVYPQKSSPVHVTGLRLS